MFDWEEMKHRIILENVKMVTLAECEQFVKITGLVLENIDVQNVFLTLFRIILF